MPSWRALDQVRRARIAPAIVVADTPFVTLTEFHFVAEAVPNARRFPGLELAVVGSARTR